MNILQTVSYRVIFAVGFWKMRGWIYLIPACKAEFPDFEVEDSATGSVKESKSSG